MHVKTKALELIENYNLNGKHYKVIPRKEFGEDLFPVVSINPDIRAINCLKQSLNREQVYNNAKI